MRGVTFLTLAILAGGLLLGTSCTAEPGSSPATAAETSVETSSGGAQSTPGSTATTPAASPELPASDPPSLTSAPAALPSASSPPGSSPSSGPSGSTVTAPLTLYYVALEDGGIAGEKIGCGDSLVATYTEPVSFSNQLQATMERLLADGGTHHGMSGLHNALSQSDVEFTSGTVAGDTVTVQLSGRITVGGTCDVPRVTAQLEQAAKTATGTGSASIFINNVPLEEALSSR